MERLCYVCDVCGEIEDQPGVRICDCRGALRFIAFGTCPTTGKQADKLFSILREKFGLSKRRGPKKPITFLDVTDKMRELPDDATPHDVAGALGVTVRTVERVIKPLLETLSQLNPSCDTFDGLQAALKGKNKPRVKKVFYKRIRRR